MKVDKNLCVGCGACCGVCPAGAITLKDGKSEIDQTKCVNCLQNNINFLEIKYNENIEDILKANFY